jgi:hypothetical protein
MHNDTTTKTRTYWQHENGRVSCQDHGGYYLSSWIEAKPYERSHMTPLGMFYKMTAAEVVDFEAFMVEMGKRPECCETCRG